ncbi:hypothetical protein DIPPA_29401 [Diplonema papillatum]|nr:hypothetical protein DIPPA_29401 [Diplonema papillatum]
MPVLSDEQLQSEIAELRKLFGSAEAKAPPKKEAAEQRADPNSLELTLPVSDEAFEARYSAQAMLALARTGPGGGFTTLLAHRAKELAAAFSRTEADPPMRRRLLRSLKTALNWFATPVRSLEVSSGGEAEFALWYGPGPLKGLPPWMSELSGGLVASSRDTESLADLLDVVLYSIELFGQSFLLAEPPRRDSDARSAPKGAAVHTFARLAGIEVQLLLTQTFGEITKDKAPACSPEQLHLVATAARILEYVVAYLTDASGAFRAVDGLRLKDVPPDCLALLLKPLADVYSHLLQYFLARQGVADTEFDVAVLPLALQLLDEFDAGVFTEESNRVRVLFASHGITRAEPKEA